jgi:hypothetical protein
VQQRGVGLRRRGAGGWGVGGEVAQKVGEMAGVPRWWGLTTADARQQREDVAGIRAERGMALDGGVQAPREYTSVRVSVPSPRAVSGAK